MPKVNKIINSFNAGELSPKMDARTDQEKYAFGARTMENFLPLIYGGAERRPGTQYIAEQNDSSAKGRVVSFEHSVDDVYALLFENQRLQFFTGGTSPSPVYKPYGSEDLSAISNVVAHWKCDDNAATTTVVNADNPGTYDGTASANTTSLTSTDAEGTANSAFDLDHQYYFTVTDNAAFTFGDGTNDSAFSVSAWITIDSYAAGHCIISKYGTAGTQREWRIQITGTGQVHFELFDESSDGHIKVTTGEALALSTWYHIVVTYDGTGGSDAGSGVTIYIDRSKVSTSTAITGTYTAMEDLGGDLQIGAQLVNTNIWDGKIDNVALFNKELIASEVASMVGSDSTTVYNITTPYLTADLFDLKFEQSADVMYITHPSYEPRKLLRYGDAAWVLEVLGLEAGPFRDENTDISKTIVSSATTGVVTLTAVGHFPFLSSTTAGHVPSGSAITSKSQTGALFKLVQATSTDHVSGLLDPTGANTSATLAISKGVTWDLVTNGTWGQAADSATIVLERSYDSGTTYETVVSFTSAANYNAKADGTEDFADAIYRLRVTETTAGGSACAFNLSVRDTSHIGIVEITAVASGTSATATVLKTLGSTDKTHRWSEGSFSNYRGWPIDVTISAEERLTFTGQTSKPLTVYGSEVGNFTNFLKGSDDNDPLNHTLVGTGQQNRIRWVIPKDALIIGTVGGVHLLGASKDDEALTPTNVRARLQTTKGSENVSALMINQAVLFAERGGKKIRELLFDFDSDSYKADDLTVFAEHIMGEATTDGVVDMAYQRTPGPILWCVRNDGQMAVMSYERDQKVFAWSRFTTTDGTSDSSFESVAVIYGGARSEDEVWVTVKRTVNSSTVRYVERFKPRNWGTDDDDAFFVDSGLTYDSTAASTVTAAHLKGETCSVLGDGVVFDDAVANAATGVITLKKNGVATTASTVQYGLSYTSTLKPMKLNIEGQGRAATYKILEGVLSLYKTMRGEWGSSTSNLNPIVYRKAGETSAEFPMTTDDVEMDFEGEHDRSGDVIVRQTDPVPMTLLSLALDVQVEPD